MLKRLIGNLSVVVFALAITITLQGSSAFAFDPFTIITAVQGAKSLLGRGDSSLIEDISDAGFSFSGLLEDLDVDASGDESIKQKLTELIKLRKKLDEMKDEGQDLVGDANELSETSQIKSKIESIRSMIRTSKAMAALVIAKPKASEKVFQIQEVRLNYMMLDELTRANQRAELAKLNEEMCNRRVQLLASQIAKEEKEAKR